MLNKVRVKRALKKRLDDDETGFYLRVSAVIFSVYLLIFSRLFPTEEIFLTLVTAYVSTLITLLKLIGAINMLVE